MANSGESEATMYQLVVRCLVWQTGLRLAQTIRRGQRAKEGGSLRLTAATPPSGLPASGSRAKGYGPETRVGVTNCRPASDISKIVIHYMSAHYKSKRHREVVQGQFQGRLWLVITFG